MRILFLSVFVFASSFVWAAPSLNVQTLFQEKEVNLRPGVVLADGGIAVVTVGKGILIFNADGSLRFRHSIRGDAWTPIHRMASGNLVYAAEAISILSPKGELIRTVPRYQIYERDVVVVDGTHVLYEDEDFDKKLQFVRLLDIDTGENREVYRSAGWDIQIAPVALGAGAFGIVVTDYTKRSFEVFDLDGRDPWKTDLFPPYSEVGAFAEPLVLKNGNLLLSGEAGSLTLIDVSKRKALKWKTQPHGVSTLWDPPMELKGGNILVPSGVIEKGRYAVYSTAGKELFRNDELGPTFPAPADLGERIVFGTSFSNVPIELAFVNAKTGKVEAIHRPPPTPRATQFSAVLPFGKGILAIYANHGDGVSDVFYLDSSAQVLAQAHVEDDLCNLTAIDEQSFYVSGLNGLYRLTVSSP